MERIEFNATGSLPEKGTHTVMGEAEQAFEKFISGWNENHPEAPVTGEVKRVKSGTRKPRAAEPATPIIQAATLAPAPELIAHVTPGPAHPRADRAAPRPDARDAAD